MPPVQQFRVREKLLRILRTVGATEKLFTTKQIITYLGRYIERKKLHDSKNMCIVRCKGDLLEELFGVQEFTIDSFKNIWQFIFPHIIPATNKEVLEHESECRNKDVSEGSSDAAPGKVDFQWMSQLPWWYFVEKDSKAVENHDVATASGSFVATSTAYVVDTDYESDSNVSRDARPGALDEDRFSVEYEPDSDDSNRSDATEPVESEEEIFRPSPLPRIDYSEDTTTTDNTDVSMDFDIPLEDHWRCHVCITVNPPTVRYCQRCWKLRRGWLSDTSFLCPELGKSHTLPAGEFFQLCTPVLSRSLTQPNRSSLGIDVADGKISKDEQPKSSHDPESNFNELPFNNPGKRKLDSSDEANSPPLSKLKPASAKASTSKFKSITMKSSSTTLFATSSDSTTPEDQSSSSSSKPTSLCSFSAPGLCNICHNNPNDATIVHGNLGHQYCCYRCAKKLEKRGKTCPVCRQPIAFVVKNYICQM